MVTLTQTCFYGLKDDTKPTYIERIQGLRENIQNGFPFYEIDSGNISMWDAEHSTWIQQQ